MGDEVKDLYKEFAKLAPSGLVELYILDATDLGGERFYFYDGTGQATNPELPNPVITFQGQAYNPMPIEVKGFEFKTQGELPRPTVRFSNVFGTFTALSLLFDDLIGATFIRKRVLRKNLDDGSDPSPTELPEDVFYVDRKASENKQFVEFELGSILDVDGLILPRRQVLSNICGVRYRGFECSFAQNRFVANSTDGGFPTDLPLVKYRGVWDTVTVFNKDEGVSQVQPNGDEYFYRCIADTSHNNDPATFTTKWTLVQKYRQEWSSEETYTKNDVVYVLDRKGFRQFFICLAPSITGDSTQPPNATFWQPDQCGKLLSSCKLRFDPLGLNQPLPAAMFPGTSQTPEV